MLDLGIDLDNFLDEEVDIELDLGQDFEDKPIQIYTSYFKNMKDMGKDFNFVSVANRPPNEFVGRTLHRLTPDMRMVNNLKDGNIEYFEFEYRYKQALDYLEKEENYFKELVKQFKDEKHPTVLLCHEETGEWCHRHLLKPYFERAGAIYSEYLTVEDLFEDC